LGHEGLVAKFIEKGRLSIRSRFWEVIHDPEKGGCITSIRFFNGSNRNILLNPISSYFGSFSDTLNEKATVSLAEEEGCIAVKATGELSDANKYAVSGVRYEYTYRYYEGYVKIAREYSFEKGVAGIGGIGIGCMNVTPELNCFAARLSYITLRNNPSLAQRPADIEHMRCEARWGKVKFDGEAGFEDKNVPIYMGVFNPGIEGVEFIPGHDLEEWTRQLIMKENPGRFQIVGESSPTGVRIIVEPFHSSVSGYSGVKLSGKYHFSSFIGLPNIPEKVPRKYMHVAFNNHPWPSDEEIRKWAYSGVTVVRLHNDYHPSGDFWHDGSWPPYNEKGMAELRRVIDTCHRYGMKIVPYFSLYEINPKSDAFADGYVVWRRTVDDRGSLLETYPPDHYYGFGVCLSSGWKDFLKGYVKKVVKTLGFDGIYYDYSRYWFCNNRLHSKGDHLIIEDLIDFLRYTRTVVGEEGVMIVHTSGWFPCVIVENYVDADVMFEDNVRWREIPPLEEFPPNTMHLTFMNVNPKIPCSISGVPDQVNAAWDLCAKCSVFGAFPTTRGAAAALTLFETFRAFDLSQYKFKYHIMGHVTTSDKAVKGAVYFNNERALIVLANVGDTPVGSFKWTADLEGIGWDPSQKYHMTGSLGKPISVVEGKDLAEGGSADSLGALRFKVYSIVSYRGDKKYVLYNTRAWTESIANGELTVETKGPVGQEATLVFFSPEKPKEVGMDSKSLKESDDWTWDKTTRIGTVTYTYADTKKKVIFRIV